MIYTIFAITALLAYFIGSINTSIILSKTFYGDDIRNSGSGNAGATNMLRTHGKGVAFLTLICDILKGSLVVFLTYWLDIVLISMYKGKPMSTIEYDYIFGNLTYIAGFFVVLGHDFPIWFGFKGGKGVATSLGVIIATNWKIGLIVLAVALIIMIFSRYVSLGSITAAVVYPFILLTYIIASEEKINLTYLAMAVLLALMLVLKHHSNIKRLKNGTENKLFAKKVTAEDDNKCEEEQE